MNLPKVSILITVVEAWFSISMLYINILPCTLIDIMKYVIDTVKLMKLSIPLSMKFYLRNNTSVIMCVCCIFTSVLHFNNIKHSFSHPGPQRLHILSETKPHIFLLVTEVKLKFALLTLFSMCVLVSPVAPPSSGHQDLSHPSS